MVWNIVVYFYFTVWLVRNSAVGWFTVHRKTAIGLLTVHSRAQKRQFLPPYSCLRQRGMNFRKIEGDKGKQKSVTGSSKLLGGRRRRSSIAKDKSWTKYSANILQITMIFGRLPRYLADYHDHCPWPTHWTRIGDYCTGAILWLCDIFVSCHMTVNTQTAMFGHLVTSPFTVPFEP